MADGDKSIAVRITGTVDPSLAASTAAASAEIEALAGASTKTSATIATDFQGIINSTTGVSSSTKSAKDSFVAFADAVGDQKKLQAAANALENIDTEVTKGHGSASAAAREFRALFDELSSGRTKQTPGTLAIIGQRVLGMGPAALLAAGGVAALVAGLGYLIVTGLEAADALEKTSLAASFVGNKGISTESIQSSIKALDDLAGVSTKDAEEVVRAFSTMRDMSGPELQGLSLLVGEYAQTMGEKAPEAAKAFIAAMENEKLSAKDLAKLVPSITQAQVDNIEKTQQMGNVHATTAAILETVNSALVDNKQKYVEANTSMTSSFGNFIAYIGYLQQGMTQEQIHTAIINDNTAAWEKNQRAILGDIAALKKQPPKPPLTDIQSPVEKTRDAIAKLDSMWTGSTAARYQAEADLWQKVANGTEGSAKDRQAAERSADEAIFHSHEASASAAKTAAAAAKTARHQASEETLRDIEETATTQQKGSADQIATLQNLYNTAVRLEGAKSAAALSALRQLTAAQREAAQQEIATRAQADESIIAKANETAREEIDTIRQKFSQQQISAAEEIALMSQTEDTRNELVKKELADELNMWAGYPEKLNAINKQIEANERTHSKAISDIAKTGANSMVQEYSRAWSPITNGFNSMVRGIFSGNQTLVQVLGQGALTIAEDYIQLQLRQLEETIFVQQAKTAATAAGVGQRSAVEAAGNSGFFGKIGQQLAEWLGLETSKTAETVAGATARATAAGAETAAGIAEAKALALAEIPAYTGIAAMGAAAAVAPIPIIGPELAAAAFASMQGLGATALGMASLDSGTNFVPNDMIAQIHAGERIIPAAENADLMDAVDGGGGKGSGGDTYHFHALDASSVLKLFKANPAAFAAGARSAGKRLMKV
jgi:hypothetical protein